MLFMYTYTIVLGNDTTYVTQTNYEVRRKYGKNCEETGVPYIREAMQRNVDSNTAE